ncbi:hypothetical protein [Methanospirillum sp.]
MVNNSRFILQAGVFTSDIGLAIHAYRFIQVWCSTSKRYSCISN